MINMRMREFEVLDALNGGKFCTSNELIKKLSIGEKSLRAIINEINNILDSDVAVIEAKRGVGYRLLIKDYDNFSRWKKDVLESKENNIPSSSEERAEFLVLFFLNQIDYIKREDICDFLYVSEKTISHDLKRVQYIFDQYGIVLQKKTHHGMKIDGSEFSKRQCIINHYLAENSLWLINENELNTTMQKIGQIVLRVFKEWNFQIMELQLKGVVDYLYVMEHRIKRGFVITDMPDVKVEYFETDMIRQLLSYLRSDGFYTSDSEAEIYFIAIYLKGRGVTNTQLNGTTNVRISEHIAMLTEDMLQSVYQMFGINFRNNFDLQMYMNKHLNALEIRLEYGIEIVNPILDMIKKKYFFEFMMAEQACIVITKQYGKKLTDDEIAYFALLFAVENEQHKEAEKKKKVLLVCATGKTSSRFLQMILKQRFGQYIAKVDICNLYELSTYLQNQYDCIFSTIPIDQTISIPIVMLHEFLQQSEFNMVQKTLEHYNHQIMDKYYKKELFFTNVRGKKRDEVIFNMCQKIASVRKLPERFYQSVIERENLGSTDFGNMVAIPHPYEKMMDEDMVCVGILETPILWDKNYVQMVILSAISEGVSKGAKQFFEVTSTLITKKELVEKIIVQQSFSGLEECINTIVQ